MWTSNRSRTKMLAALGVLILGSLWLSGCAGLPALQAVAQPATGAAPSPTQLYLADAPERGRLIPIDSQTLADLETVPTIRVGSRVVHASSDGTTLAVLTYPPNKVLDHLSASEITIRILDTRTGRERARFHPPAPALAFELTADGSRLVLGRCEDGSPEEYVLDTSDGRVLSTLKGEGPPCSWLIRLDPAGQRLYRLVVPDFIGSASPPVLIAYDLASGAEVGRLVLDDLTAGFQRTGREIDGRPVVADWRPGVAVSPDGQQIVILHADRDALTLIDTGRLAILRTAQLSRPAGFLERLGLQPRVAYAKGSDEGRIWGDVRFSPDGRRLYAVGSESRLDAAGKPSWRGLGLRVIDVARAAITAGVLVGEPISWVMPSPDGSAVYVFSFRPRWEGTSTLRRLDARTLKITAERELAGYRDLYVLTAPAPTSASPEPSATPLANPARMPNPPPDISALARLTPGLMGLMEGASKRAACPVTQPQDPPFTPPPPYPPDAPYPDEFWYGTDALWTMLRADGRWWHLPRTEAGYAQKVFWWREGYNWREEPQPELTVTGQRLDGPAPPLRASRATNAFHPSFGSAMLVGVDIPTLGCWEITGRYGGHELSFVVWVAP